MLQAPSYQHSIDSGTGRTLIDVAGQPLYAWDALDLQTEMEYDVLRRPLKRIAGGKILEQSIYGETLLNPIDLNYRGQIYQTYDGSGRQQVNGYDFKGNPLATQIQLIEDPTITDADWTILDDTDLSTEVFISSGTFDALNRPVTTTDPGGNIQSYTYDKGGSLKTVELNAQVYVQDIHYDAKGQRMAIWYGNGTKTSYTYDEFTFRLRRLLTINLNNNEIVQDLHYWYDPIGNITEIQDDAQQSIFFNNTVVSPRQQFTYDALYRLIQAQGRELIGTATFGSEDNWNDAAWQTTQKGDGNAVQNYTQLYTYDAVGNILELQHIATAGSYTRTYAIATDSNQLLSTTVGSATYTYQYDARGNMTEMPHLDGMHWNLNNELHQIANGTMEAFYQYSGGQRIRKYVDKGSIKEERIYLGSFEIYRKFDHTSSLIIERTTVHVSDDTGRIAMLEERTVGTDPSPAELTRYIYSNHLQSASLELDEDAEIISYEEYHPYGTTSYQAMNASINAVAKRYRYTGKERDEESGLYYMSARYYIPWLCRWSAVDALQSDMPTWSSYNYGFCNPVIFTDPSGNNPEDNGTVTVKKGQGVWDIAKSQLGNNASNKEINDLKNSIIKWNNLNENGDIDVGQTLFIKDPSQKDEINQQKEWSFGIKLGYSAVIATALSLYTGRYGTYAQVRPEVMESLSEEQKEKDFVNSAAKTTAILMWEFATGTGKEHRKFDESHAITDEIKWSESSRLAMWAMVEDFQNNKYKDGETRGYYAAMAPDKDISNVESFRRHANAYLSTPSTFYRGGLYYRMTKVGNDIVVKVTDAYTIASMLTRNSKDNIKRDPNKTTPLGNTSVEFHFIWKDVHFNAKRKN